MTHDCRQHIRREVRISGTRLICAVCDREVRATVSVEDQLPPRRHQVPYRKRRPARFTRGGYLRGGAG